MPSISLLSARDAKTNSAAVPMASRVPIDGHTQTKNSAFMKIKAPTLWIDYSRLTSQCTEDGIIEFLGGVNIVSAEHDVTEHNFSFFKIRFRSKPICACASSNGCLQAQVAIKPF
jgi:hypothetical protein